MARPGGSSGAGSSEQRTQGSRSPNWSPLEDICLIQVILGLVVSARYLGSPLNVNWEEVSTLLFDNHQVDRRLGSCQGRWDTLFKGYRCIWKHDSTTGQSTGNRYWSMTAEQISRYENLSEAKIIPWELYVLMDSVIQIEADKDSTQKNVEMARRTKRTRRTGRTDQVDLLASTSTQSASAAPGPSLFVTTSPLARLDDEPGSHEAGSEQPEISEEVKSVPDATAMAVAKRGSGQMNLQMTRVKRLRSRTDLTALTSSQNDSATTRPSEGDALDSQGTDLHPDRGVRMDVSEVQLLEERIRSRMTAHLDSRLAPLWNFLSAISMGNVNSHGAQGGLVDYPHAGAGLTHGYEQHANQSTTNTEDQAHIPDAWLEWINHIINPDQS